MMKMILLSFVFVIGCKDNQTAEAAAHPQAQGEPQQAPAPAHLGATIAPDAKLVALADVAKSPAAFQGKSFTTAGTVTAVCQEAGCWMEIKDAAGEAHIRMAGHGFYVPRTAGGHHAKVQATLIEAPASAEAPTHCDQEAEEQMGHAVAKLQLEAIGVELD